MTPLHRAARITHRPPQSSPSQPAADGRAETVLSNGWRIVGQPAATIFAAAQRREAVAYSSRFLVRPRLGTDAVGPLLEVLSSALARIFPDAVALARESAAEVRVDDASSCQWRTTTAGDRWIAELTWRAPMVTCPGFATTTRIAFSELPGRLSLHVQASVPERAITAKREASRPPAALALLTSAARFVVDGRPLEAEMLTSGGVPRFVRDELIGSTRHRPVLLMSPREDGSFPVAPDVLLREFAGLAHVRVLADSAATYALSDALGTRRLSCYLGALRLYWSNFALDTSEERLPLLLCEDAIQPFERDNLAHLCARRAVQSEAPYEDFDTQSAVLAPAVKARERSKSTDRAAVLEGSASGGDGSSASAGRASGGPRPSIRSSRAPRTGDESEAGAVPAPAAAVASANDEVLRIVLATVGDLGRMTEQLRRDLTAAQAEIVSLQGKVDDANARWARVASIDHVLRESQLFPELALPAPAPVPDPVGKWTADTEATRTVHVERVPTQYTISPLVAVVRAARDAHPDRLVMTAGAERAAADSPYDAPDRVAAALDALAEVARLKSLGTLKGGIRQALRVLGFEYQSGIPKGTSRRMRQQYEAYCPDGSRVLCSEHLSLGTSYDPARCLRIYFACRGVRDGRIVVGHVGRHFDVKTTS